MINLTVFLIQFVINRKIPRCLFILQILGNQFIAHRNLQFLIILNHFGQILPGSGRHYHQPVHCGFHPIEILLPDIQIADHTSPNSLPHRIFLPCFVIRLHFHHFQPIPCSCIEFPDAFIKSGRIAGSHYHPSFRYLMPPKNFILQK